VTTLASHSGWSYEFIVWQLPMAVGEQFRHAIHWQRGMRNFNPLIPEIDEQQLQSQLKSVLNSKHNA
jgi:hypothetical protein